MFGAQSFSKQFGKTLGGFGFVVCRRGELIANRNHRTLRRVVSACHIVCDGANLTQQQIAGGIAIRAHGKQQGCRWRNDVVLAPGLKATYGYHRRGLWVESARHNGL